MDGIKNPKLGYIIRGGREMEAHFETLWDLFRSIPSLEDENVSVLDEFYWLNKDDPSFSHTRIIENRGQQIPDDGKLTLTPRAIRELVDLAMTPEDKLQDVQIGQRCLRLNAGPVRWKCVVTYCALSTMWAVWPICPH